MSEIDPFSERNLRLTLKLGAGIVGGLLVLNALAGLATEKTFNSADARAEASNKGYTDVKVTNTNRLYLPWPFGRRTGCGMGNSIDYKIQAVEPASNSMINLSVCKRLLGGAVTVVNSRTPEN